jgi:hypothetical protein
MCHQPTIPTTWAACSTLREDTPLAEGDDKERAFDMEIEGVVLGIFYNFQNWKWTDISLD